jgi:hypothetical protein
MPCTIASGRIMPRDTSDAYVPDDIPPRIIMVKIRLHS